MALLAKLTAVTATDTVATLTIEVVNDSAPTVVVWTGPLEINLDAPPEQLDAALEQLMQRELRRRARLQALQALIGTTRPIRR